MQNILDTMPKRKPLTTFSIMQNADQNEVSFDNRIYTVKDAEGVKVFEGTHKECMAFMRFGTNV